MRLFGQSQKAGDNSQQVQANTYIDTHVENHYGLDEERVREIINEEINVSLSAYSIEAQDIARERINCFKDELIPMLVRKNLLSCLKDPSIQLLLIEAQKTAASTERQGDYIILSELLAHRAQNNDSSDARIGVSRAIEVVDKVSDEALLGLTAAYSFLTYNLLTGSISESLGDLDNFFGKLIKEKLPKGTTWLEQLDILDAVRLSGFGTMRDLSDLCRNHFSGYIAVGIDKLSDDYQKALELLNSIGFSADILIDHELRDGFVRLPFVDCNIINSGVLFREYVEITEDGNTMKHRDRLSDSETDIIKKVYALYNLDGNLLDENVAAFVSMWDRFENLNSLRIWWDAIPRAFMITPVGKALAQANCLKYDSLFSDFSSN
ncbi:MAG: hypothetical protein LIO99_01315 [Clostridiales bacterium]|nr:hypothetical protein [Clostridiales bacterium]